MKRMIAFVLAVVVLVCFFPINAIPVYADTGETAENTHSTENNVNKIYYSDIFWGYPKILKTVYIPRYRTETWDALRLIKEEYKTTPNFASAVTHHGINIALDSDEWGKYILDNAGVTNFQHNEELDKANILFAEALFQITIDGIDSAVAENKYVGAVVDVAKVVQKIDKAVQDDKDYYSHLTKVELYDYFVGKAFVDLSNYCPRLEPQFQSLQNSLRTTFSEAIDVIGNVEDAVKFAKALAYSIRLQEVQLDLVQDIINTQPTDSTLYKGMVRLNKQLENGFVSYFTSTYITEKVYDKIAGYVSEVVENYIVGKNWISIKSATVATVGMLNTIVFDWILGVDYSEYSTASVLSYYTLDFYNSMVAKAGQIEENCTLTAVKEYETLFNAYIATTEAAFQACEAIAVHNSEYTDDWCRDQQSIYCMEGQYQAYIKEIKNTLLSMTEDERAVFLREPYLLQSGVVKGGTDNPEEGYIYTVKGQEFTGISLYRAVYNSHLNLTIELDADIVILGDVSLGNDAVLHNKGKLKVLGNLKLNGNPDKARFINDGETIIVGDIAEIQTTRFANNSIESNVADSALYVGGDIILYDASTYQIDKGKLYLNGTSQQAVKSLTVYNMDVLNPEGIAGGLYIKGEIDLNGYPCESSSIYVYQGAKFDEDSIFPNIIIIGRLEVSNNVTFTSLILNEGSDLVVLETGVVTVLGDFKTYSYYGNTCAASSITNNGKIVVIGDLNISKQYAIDTNSYINNGTTIVHGSLSGNDYSKITSDVQDSFLFVAGDLNANGRLKYRVDEGFLILNGTTTQTVKISKTSNIYIENKSSGGVIFGFDLQVTHLFDHQGNVFKTTSSSKFIDYDGDGLKDNVDPHPTIAESCLEGHSFGDWLITVEPTPSTSGEREKVCSKCNAVLTEEIPCLAGDVESWSMTLGDDLSVNFQIHIPEGIRNTAQVAITVANKTYTYTVTQAQYNNVNDCHLFSVSVAAAQLSEEITVQIINGEDVSLSKTYTVLQYAQYVLSDENLSDYHQLVKEMLNYGAAAQIYFDYNIENLVNSGLTGVGLKEIPETAPQTMQVEDNLENVSLYGVSLVFENKTAVRYYFTVSDDINQYTFGDGLIPVRKGDYYYVEVAGINPQDLDDIITLSVCHNNENKLFISYNPINYLVRMNSKGSNSLKALLKAMYNYHLAAEQLCPDIT